MKALTIRQVQAMAAVREGGSTHDVAEKLSTSRINALQLCQRLASKGLLRFGAKHTLTAKGLKALEAALKQLRALEAA